MTRRLLLILIFATFSVGCSGGGYDYSPAPAQSSPNQGAGATVPAAAPNTAGQVEVAIQNFAFTPASITVPAGTTVRWTQMDSTAHTVTSDKGVFDSKSLAQGQTFSYKFATPGTYSYICSFHSNMKGSVIVQ